MEEKKEMFMTAVKNHNDEAAKALMDLIFNEYIGQERKVVDETDRHYSDTSLHAYTKFCKYLQEIYWKLPDRKVICMKWSDYHKEYRPESGPTLAKTKLEIIKLWMRQWQRYNCELIDDAESIKAFRFLIAAYKGEPVYISELGVEINTQGRYVSKEEKEGILKLFREYTNSRFTPEIAEKWLKQPNVPDEIKKIFIIARAGNGGVELVERDMKYAELLRPLDVENRSQSALELLQKFCRKLAETDDKVRQLIKELGAGLCIKAERIEVFFTTLGNITLHIHFKKSDLPTYGSVRRLTRDIHLFLSEHEIDRYVKIRFVFWEGEVNRSSSSNTAYLF